MASASVNRSSCNWISPTKLLLLLLLLLLEEEEEEEEAKAEEDNPNESRAIANMTWDDNKWSRP